MHLKTHARQAKWKNIFCPLFFFTFHCQTNVSHIFHCGSTNSAFSIKFNFWFLSVQYEGVFNMKLKSKVIHFLIPEKNMCTNQTRSDYHTLLPHT